MFDRWRKAKKDADKAELLRRELYSLGNKALGALMAINDKYPEATSVPGIQKILADYAEIRRKVGS